LRIALLVALASGLVGAALGALLVAHSHDLAARLLTREAILLVVFAVAAHVLAPKEDERLSRGAAVAVLFLGVARVGLLLTIAGDWENAWADVLRESLTGTGVIATSILQAAAFGTSIPLANR
jgi:hypothetical protein